MSHGQPREHKLEQIAKFNPEWGDLTEAIICPSADNRSCVIIVKKNAPEGTRAALDPKDEETVRGLLGAPWFERIVFNNQVLAETAIYELPKFAISFDGKRMATCLRRSDGARGLLISINGEQVYEVPFDECYDLAWIGPNELAWRVGNTENKRRKSLYYFVNGEDTTGVVEFEPVWGERDQNAVGLWKHGIFCVVDDEGVQKYIEPRPYETWHSGERWSVKEKPEMPQEKWLNNNRGPLVITYQGKKHQPVDEVENSSGTRTYAFNTDRSKVAYVAIRHGRISRWVLSALMSPVYFQEIVELWASGPGIARGQYDYVPLGRRMVLNTVKTICWLPNWISAILCNPYFGPLNFFYESRKRWYPVDDGRCWSKGFDYAHDHFYTPQDELVVTVYKKDKECVVIDEDGGPLFDQINNVRFQQEEKCVSYLARQGENIYRVNVS